MLEILWSLVEMFSFSPVSVLQDIDKYNRSMAKPYIIFISIHHEIEVGAYYFWSISPTVELYMMTTL